MFGRLNFEYGDYIYIPRATVYKIVFETEQNRMFTVDSTGPIGIPDRYLSEQGQFLENSPFCERDLRLPEEPLFFDEEGEFEIRIKKQGRYTSYWYNHHPFDIVGWDGYLYPWIFNIKNFEPLPGVSTSRPPFIRHLRGLILLFVHFVRVSLTIILCLSRLHTLIPMLIRMKFSTMLKEIL